MKIKVCGLKEPENIKAVATLTPDYAGFIFYKLSTRYVEELPIDIFKNFPGTIIKTAVFVNEDAKTINALINKYQFDAIQLHGNESAGFCNSFLNKVKVIKAFGISDTFNFDILKQYAGVVDYFLFDTQSLIHGGSGKVFNWSLINQYKLNVPFFLSGGLSIDNLEDIKKIVHPQLYGVDLNSRFERAPGIKDTEKLKKAFQLINKANTNELRS